MLKCRWLGLIGAGFLLGCSLTPPPVSAGRPGWMENPQQKYPFNRYLTAVGEGDTLAAAESVALGNLSKIFESHVTVDERLAERYVELTGKVNLYQEQTQFDRDVTVRSSLSLLNVQYPERYTDRQTGRVYVLAALPRAETAEVYVTRLTQNNAMVKRFVERAELAATPAVRFASFSAAVAVSSDCSRLLDQLDILQPAAKSRAPLNFAHDDLTQRMGDAAREIGFSVHIQNDPQGKLAQTVRALLTELGFSVSPEGGFLRVRGAVGMEPTDLGRQGLSFVRYTMQMVMEDAHGMTVAALNESGREGHVAEVEAINRCVRSMQTAVQRELPRRLFAYFDGLAVQ